MELPFLVRNGNKYKQIKQNGNKKEIVRAI